MRKSVFWVFALLITLAFWRASGQIPELGPPPVPTAAVVKRAPERITRHIFEPAGWIDTQNRQAVVDAYRDVFLPTNGVPIGWTGNLETGEPGTTSDVFRMAVFQRINFVRGLAGVPARVTENSEFSSKAQQAALMMSANQDIDHFPPQSWMFWTAEGAEAAQNSNLCARFSQAGTFADSGCVTGYIRDFGAGNFAVGHRRWILHPQTQEMGTGDVPQNGAFPNTNAIWVFDGRTFDPRPPTRDGFIAWPPPGFVPWELIFERWSFAFPGADFGGATVTMERDGQLVAAPIEPMQQGFGDPAIVWVPESSPPEGIESTTQVTISNVVVNGEAPEFTYSVTSFDPNAAGGAVNPVFSSAGLANSGSFLASDVPSDAWMDLFGEHLAQAEFLLDPNLPESLDGTSITIVDSQGTSHQARIHFVTPNRVQFLTPPGMAPGPAMLTLRNATGGELTINVSVATVAPGLFSANASGQGPAAAVWQRFPANTSGFTFTLDTVRQNDPIDLGGPGDQIFISFFGTGFRNQTSVSCRMNGTEVPVTGAVAQGQFEGLDQAVAGPIPRSFVGSGKVDVEWTFNGIAANIVEVSFR